MTAIGVGVIGASISRGWASSAHFPAIAALPEFELVAVSTTRQATANEVRDRYHAHHAFDSHEALVRCVDVDLVVVTVKVPHHRELVSAAIAAGKHVLCEWPLGNGLSEAEDLLAQAQVAGVKHFVGLQARRSPVVRYVRDLLAEGFVGRVLASTMIVSEPAWGELIDVPNAYIMHRTNGAMLHTITGGHAADMMCHLLGEFTELAAAMTVQRPHVRVIRGDTIEKTAPDQIIVAGFLTGNVAASLHMRTIRRGSAYRAGQFEWQISGTEGDLMITAAGANPQMYELELRGARGDSFDLQELPVPASYNDRQLANVSGFARNVGGVYLEIAKALRCEPNESVDFHQAVVRHRMIDALELAAQTGARQSYERL